MKNYRDKDNTPISYDQWRSICASESVASESVDHEGGFVNVFMQYVGLPHCLYKVYVECDSNHYKYSDYCKSHKTKGEALADFDRIKEAILIDGEIKDKTVITNEGDYELRYDSRVNYNLIIDRTVAPSAATAFIDRAEAETKYAKLIDFGRQVFELGKVEATYSTRYDKFLVIDRRNYPSQVFSYATKEEALTKYSELTGA